MPDYDKVYVKKNSDMENKTQRIFFKIVKIMKIVF